MKFNYSHFCIEIQQNITISCLRKLELLQNYGSFKEIEMEGKEGLWLRKLLFCSKLKAIPVKNNFANYNDVAEIYLMKKYFQ